jgi:alpha-L-fucosidase
MRYVNLTARHHDGFCLWDTATTDFNSARGPARRDLVAELVAACDRRGLGCFLYCSHGRDWFHPDSPANGEPSCRPECSEDRDHFHWDDAVDLDRYAEFCLAQVMELCRYAPLAGIWLDGIGGPKGITNGAERMRVQELYDRIHAAQPQVLVSYKQGLTGTEDFFAPERGVRREGEGLQPDEGGAAGPARRPPDALGWRVLHDLRVAWTQEDRLRTGPVAADGRRGPGTLF